MKIIKEVRRPHGCTAELATIAEDLWIGSIVECSCGQQYIRDENQRDGMYWAPIPAVPAGGDGWPYEPSARTGGYISPPRTGILPPLPYGPAEGLAKEREA